jgi:hypothetical protein
MLRRVYTSPHMRERTNLSNNWFTYFKFRFFLHATKFSKLYVKNDRLSQNCHRNYLSWLTIQYFARKIGRLASVHIAHIFCSMYLSLMHRSVHTINNFYKLCRSMEKHVDLSSDTYTKKIVVSINIFYVTGQEK